jgi:2-amino-4-hydroxy-6-hydroxymethyldihydropteridine diphosphokinase
VSAAAVAFGANLGDPERAFAEALASLVVRPGVRVRGVSSLWRSEAWGRTDQPDFLNGVALLETPLPPRALLELLVAEEGRAGRVRGERWGPRTLDLDLVFVDDETREEPGLELPHPRLAERSFVLEPLAEVAADWRHPRTGLGVAEMRAALRASGAWTTCARVDGSRLGVVAPREPACRS